MLNRILDSLPPGPVMIFGGLYFFMPILPEPHLVQKFLMVKNGIPLAPIDMFDVFVHTLGGVVAVLMFRRQRQLQNQEPPASDPSSEE
ncbi:hypothetical protein V5T82_00205 [Magnetovibrio sp. PR-2]|uniref:hypothetical protein n=1 Tax=Magnetovibrio sp. PR-2 TaxID=3120356 RepID=UPI002FCE2CD7